MIEQIALKKKKKEEISGENATTTPNKPITSTPKETVKEQPLEKFLEGLSSASFKKFLDMKNIQLPPASQQLIQAKIAQRERDATLLPSKEKAKELETRQQEGLPFLEEKGFFEEKIPEKIELDTERTGIEKAPVVGSSIKAVSRLQEPITKFVEENIEQPYLELGGVSLKPEWLGISRPEEIKPLIQNPQTAREIALQEIQKEVIKQGTSGSEKFGAFIEALPAVNNFAKWLGALETPSSNINTLIGTITEEATRAQNLAEKVSTGRLRDGYLAYNEIEKIEENLVKLEMRIKILIEESAVYIADADKVNDIEVTILRARQNAFSARTRAAEGALLKETNENVFLELKSLKEKK